MTTSTPEAVMQHHVQALIARDLDAIVSDYAEGAVLFTTDNVMKGLGAIREHFENILNIFPPGTLEGMTVTKQYIEGEFVFVHWSIDELSISATDTLCIRNGKIVMQAG